MELGLPFESVNLVNLRALTFLQKRVRACLVSREPPCCCRGCPPAPQWPRSIAFCEVPRGPLSPSRPHHPQWRGPRALGRRVLRRVSRCVSWTAGCVSRIPCRAGLQPLGVESGKPRRSAVTVYRDPSSPCTPPPPAVRPALGGRVRSGSLMAPLPTPPCRGHVRGIGALLALPCRPHVGCFDLQTDFPLPDSGSFHL